MNALRNIMSASDPQVEIPLYDVLDILDDLSRAGSLTDGCRQLATMQGVGENTVDAVAGAALDLLAAVHKALQRHREVCEMAEAS